MSDDMRGLFFIVKGQYKKGVTPSFVNEITGDTSYIGGYDPFSDETPEWYMLMDKHSFHCVACGSSFDQIIKGVYNQIIQHKGVAKSYYKYVSKVTSDDYYETHYLGHKPLTREQVTKKAEGRCPRVSPVMRCLYEEIYNTFGDYYEKEIQEQEDLAYEVLADKTPQRRAQRLKKKIRPIETPPAKEEPVLTKKVIKKRTLKLK